jgi:hypothetical protein
MAREEKVILIENELSRNGIKHPFLLERALGQPLPKQVKANVETMIRQFLLQSGDSV